MNCPIRVSAILGAVIIAASSLIFSVVPAAANPLYSWSPSLAVDSSGTMYAAWSQAYSIYLASRPLDGTWSTPTLVAPPRPGGSADQPKVAVNDQGVVGVIWSEDRDTEGADVYFACRTGSGAWSAVERIGSGCSPALAVDGQGNFFALWAARTPANGPYSWGIFSSVRPEGRCE
jgi:hypothetical protein